MPTHMALWMVASHPHRTTVNEAMGRKIERLLLYLRSGIESFCWVSERWCEMDFATIHSMAWVWLPFTPKRVPSKNGHHHIGMFSLPEELTQTGLPIDWIIRQLSKVPHEAAQVSRNQNLVLKWSTQNHVQD